MISLQYRSYGGDRRLSYALCLGEGSLSHLRSSESRCELTVGESYALDVLLGNLYTTPKDPQRRRYLKMRNFDPGFFEFSSICVVFSSMFLPKAQETFAPWANKSGFSLCRWGVLNYKTSKTDYTRLDEQDGLEVALNSILE